MADCAHWGYTHIRGALYNLGHEIGRSTIKRILLEAGIDPEPARSKRMPSSVFVRAHWGAITAMDFFTVEVVAWSGLVRVHACLDNKLVVPMNDNAANSGRVARRQRLGGVLNYYYREAA